MRVADSPLLTDLYQLTMIQSYLDHGLTDTAVFEFFVRRLPEHRNFLLFAGLEQVLSFLEGLHFDERELDWLSADGRFSDRLVEYLRNLRFDGDVHAMTEGTVFFADEPVLRVTAPLPLAQLVESRLINILQFQILVASKAARMRLAAREGSLLVDFGMRRAHEADAALMAARAGYIAGLSGTSNVLAGMQMGVPLYGTMAHSFVLAHDSEEQAFLDFARSHPDQVVLLIDTYDTEQAAAKLASVAAILQRDGITIRGVRLDSGDLAEHAVRVRHILDESGLEKTVIFASGNLDEYELLRLRDAPIDGFGIGTRMDTSADVPYLDCAYKLQEYAGVARRKTSEGKATWPGRKQVVRHMEDDVMDHDVLALSCEVADGEGLLAPVIVHGERCADALSLEDIRDHAASQLAMLPEPFHGLSPPEHCYPLRISEAVRQLADEVDRRQH